MYYASPDRPGTRQRRCRILGASLALLAATATSAQSRGFVASGVEPASIESASMPASGPAGPQFPSGGGGDCPVALIGGTTPAGGYLGLDAFGITPIASPLDDAVYNYNVPAYQFGGRLFTRIGFSTNGYALIGGSSQSADNSRVNQGLPSTAAPNGVIAPFWTDLNPSAGGAMRIGTLTNGVSTWLVLDWGAIPEYSTGLLATFEIWIGLAGNSNPEDVSIAYSTIQGFGNGGNVTVGIEDTNGVTGRSVHYNGLGTLPTATTQYVALTCDRVFKGGFDTK